LNHVGGDEQHAMSVAEPQSAVPKPKLRWYQFSLRTLLVFVTLSAIPCSWVGMRMRQAERQAERQRAAVEGITNAGTEEGGGVVWYDCDDDSQGIVITGKTPGPAWLRRILGDDFFRHPIGAIVTTDEGLVYAKRLPELQKLQAYGYKWEGDEGHMVLAIKTKVTNTGLQHLVELTQLRFLSLDYAKITDAGLGHLKRMTRLQGLSLIGTDVTEPGVRELQQALPSCKIELRPPTKGERQSPAAPDHLR
jgi:hypothetical protein